jgi:integrase
MAETKRRARGEDSIYFDRSRDRWTGTITVGWKPDGRRDRITVRGRTKTEVKDKLKAKHQELAAGIRTPASYTVQQCLKDWLETLNTQAETTVTGYRIMTRHLVELIGNVKLTELKVRDVDFALASLANRLSTRSVRLARMILIQAIRNAMVNDLVVRNVADLAAVPTGKAGRPSKSLNLDQALAVLDAAKGERLWPYVAVSMLGGIRTEEARALRWSEVDLEAGTVAVYRSVRRTGETKTERTTWCSARASAARCTRPMSGWSSSGSPRRRVSAGTGRRVSFATPLFRSCRIPACPSSRSRTRSATQAPGPPRLYIGISSGQLPAPPPSRWARCSRAEGRPTEAGTEPLGFQLGCQTRMDRNIKLMSSENSEG